MAMTRFDVRLVSMLCSGDGRSSNEDTRHARLHRVRIEYGGILLACTVDAEHAKERVILLVANLKKHIVNRHVELLACLNIFQYDVVWVNLKRAGRHARSDASFLDERLYLWS